MNTDFNNGNVIDEKNLNMGQYKGANVELATPDNLIGTPRPAPTPAALDSMRASLTSVGNDYNNNLQNVTSTNYSVNNVSAASAGIDYGTLTDQINAVVNTNVNNIKNSGNSAFYSNVGITGLEKIK